MTRMYWLCVCHIFKRSAHILLLLLSYQCDWTNRYFLEDILSCKIIHAIMEIHQRAHSVTIMRCSSIHWWCYFLILRHAKCWEFCELSQVWDVTQWAHGLAPIRPAEDAYHLKALKEAACWNRIWLDIVGTEEMSSERISCPWSEQHVI